MSAWRVFSLIGILLPHAKNIKTVIQNLKLESIMYDFNRKSPYSVAKYPPMINQTLSITYFIPLSK